MLHEKEAHLTGYFKEMGSCIVAFSGGVDSAYLALIAHQELGAAALAVTAESPSYPTHQRNIALDLVRSYGFRHEIVDVRRDGGAELHGEPLEPLLLLQTRALHRSCNGWRRSGDSVTLSTATTWTTPATIARAVRLVQSWKSGAP